LTGGIREGAKGEPPVAYFYSGTVPLLPTVAHALPISSDHSTQGFSNFFLFIRRFFGIRHDSGGTLSVRFVIEYYSATLFSRGLFHQQ